MKNIHLIPTDKPSRLIIYSTLLNEFRLLDEPIEDWEYKRNIYITSNEEIKEGDWFYLDDAIIVAKYINVKPDKEAQKIILTTDQDLINDGVQAIDDEFLEWFVDNSSCEEVEVSYDVLKPFQSENKGYLIHCPDNEVLEEPKQETIDEVSVRNWFNDKFKDNLWREGFKAGEEWQAERMYSEKDLRDAYNYGIFAVPYGKTFDDWFKERKK